MLRDHIKFRLRRNQFDAHLKAADHAEVMIVMIGYLPRGVSSRNPQLTLLQQWVKSLRHNSNEVVNLAVHAQCLSDDRWIGMEPRAPQPFTDYDYLCMAGLVLIAGENASSDRRNTERGEIVPCGDFTLDALGILQHRQVETGTVGRGKIRERSASLLHVGEVTD